MKKENRNPNRSQNTLNKSINSKYHCHASNTPDTSTSRINYKPKFIKKTINIHQEIMGSSATTPHQSVQQSADTYMHSPTSLTEHNTIDMEAYRMKNIWKERYLSTKEEMEARSDKFDKSIKIFCFILNDVKRIINDQHMFPEDKLILSEEKIDSLLETFE